MRESLIEKYLRTEVERLGGRCLKFSSPGTRGVPDRITLLPGGVIVFVEVKAPRKQLRKLQEHWFEVLGTLGQRVEMVDSYEGVDVLMEELAVCE